MKSNNKKADNGNGTLRQRANGRFEYRISYVDVDGMKKRKSFYGDSDIECFEKADYFTKKLEKKKSGIDMDTTIVDIVKGKCRSDFEKNFVHEQGYSRNLYTIAIIERSSIGKIPIADLTAGYIDMFLRSLTDYSNSTIVKVYRHLRLAFREAYNKGIIQKNILESSDLRCPKSKKKDKKVFALNKNEQQTLVEYLKNYHTPKGRNSYVEQIMISLLSGLRMGEVNALHPNDIDFKHNVIHVRSTVSCGLHDRVFIKDGTKTESGTRDVPIMDNLKPILKTSLKKATKNPYGLLFYDNNNDKIITTNQVNSFFQRACEKCNIEIRGQHSLRHTFATRCIEAGVPAVVIKNWLGHTDIHITLDTYADVFNSMHNDSILKLGKYISDISNNN